MKSDEPQALSPKSRLSKRVILVVLCSCTAAMPVAAREAEPGEVAKPAWQWSVDERLAKRFASEAMAARRTEREIRSRAVLEQFPEMKKDFPAEKPGEGTGPITDTVEGRRTPELYLPWELFNSLLNRAFPPDGHYRNELRRPIEQRAAALGLGSDLWDRLAKVSALFLKIQREADRLHASSSTGHLKEDQRNRLCRARADALEAAKRDFGEEEFLRFLYEAVAPEVQLTYVVDSRLPDELRFIEGGCR